MIKSWMWKQRSFREQLHGDEGNRGTGGSPAPDADAPNPDAHSGEDNPDDQPDQDPDADPALEDDGVVITLGGDTPPQEDDENQQAPQWVKDLRKEHRELQRQKRDLEKKLAERDAASAPATIQVGEKPTLASCDFDEDRFERELTTWHEKKRQADEQVASQRKEQEAAQAAWQERVTSYQSAKASLKVPDFEDAEAAVLGALNQTQHGIIVHGAADPAALTYAIGKNPAKLKELAAIKDPVKYAFAVAKLETQMKVTPRKVAPAPERKVGGGAGGSTSMDSTLARLEAEAERTGDRSKVISYKREQKRKAA